MVDRDLGCLEVLSLQLTIKKVAQRAMIAHLSPMCRGQSAPKPYAAFSHLNDATYKIWSRLANWLQRYPSSKVWNFHHSRASNSKMSGLIRLKIELDQAFMPALVTSNFDEDSIRNEWASMEAPFSHYKPIGNVLDAQGQLPPSQWSDLAEVRTWPRFYACPR